MKPHNDAVFAKGLALLVNIEQVGQAMWEATFIRPRDGQVFACQAGVNGNEARRQLAAYIDKEITL